MESEPTISGSSGIWCCWRAEAHHRTSVFALLSCSLFDRIQSETSSMHADTRLLCFHSTSKIYPRFPIPIQKLFTASEYEHTSCCIHFTWPSHTYASLGRTDPIGWWLHVSYPCYIGPSLRSNKSNDLCYCCDHNLIIMCPETVLLLLCVTLTSSLLVCQSFGLLRW